MKTTKGMSPGDTLIAVGKWLNEGLEIEERSTYFGDSRWETPAGKGILFTLYEPQDYEFRVKPKKPRIDSLASLLGGAKHRFTVDTEFAELTPEVRNLLEREGLL